MRRTVPRARDHLDLAPLPMLTGDDELFRERGRLLRELVVSTAPLKVVAAGPGTGKTHAFKELLKTITGDSLVLSFINNLVNALRRDLEGLAQVHTLHGFARALLHKHGTHGVSQGCDYYPSLADILHRDASIVLERNIGHWDIEQVLHEMEEESEIIRSATESGTYYDAVGHTDSVYRVVRHLQEHREDVPRFQQVVVDEYQDFSWLETSLIQELAQFSPTLVVGDDDQALYDFKHAKADYLREVVADEHFTLFELPFSSRCTEVLVAGLHRIVAEASRRGLLVGRVPKRYESFAPTKRADSERFPKIIHAQCSVERNNAPYICRYVQRQIAEISPEDVAESAMGDHPTALITGPKQFSYRVADYLIEQGVPNITPPRRSRRELDVLDAYRRLAKNTQSRLGWRILLHVEDPGDREQIVRRALKEGDEIADLLPEDYRDRHLRIAAMVRKTQQDERPSDDERAQLEAALERPLDEVRRLLGKAEEAKGEVPTVVSGVPTIAVTTLEGAKGLQASHVFVVGMNDDHFPRSNAEPEDHDVCCMLVALARATKSCHLVSCRRFGDDWLGTSVFIQWLGELVHPVRVDRDYFLA